PEVPALREAARRDAQHGQVPLRSTEKEEGLATEVTADTEKGRGRGQLLWSAAIHRRFLSSSSVTSVSSVAAPFGVPMNPDWRARYDRALEVARRAGQVALRYFCGSLTVEWKGDHSPVTVADRETEQVLRSSLREAFPGDGFLGEEFGDTPGTSGYRWV